MNIVSTTFANKALDLKLSLGNRKPTRYELAKLLREHKRQEKYGDDISGEIQGMFDEFSKGKSIIQWSD